MVWHSADTILKNQNRWFCLPINDVYVSGNIDEELQSYLQENSYVKSAVYGDFMIGYCKPEGCPNAPDFIGYDAYSDFTQEITGLRMLKGHGPKNKDEVAVGKNLIPMLHLAVGDPISLTLNGITRQYRISGIYETVSDNGLKIMLKTEAVEECKDYSVSRGFIRLYNPQDYGAFKKDIEERFAGVAVSENWFAVENSVESISDMLKSISLVLVIAFLLFSMLNILIVLTMDIKNWHKKYGVMKSLGFTAGYIIRQNLYKYLILAAVSSAVSLSLHLLFSQRLAAFLLIDAFSSSGRLVTLIIVAFVFLILLIACLTSLTVNRIKPIELMEE